MAGQWLTFREVKDCFDAQIALPGFNAFGANIGFGQLYSGPCRDTVFPFVEGITETNQKKAWRQAIDDKAVLLDTSPIGQFVETFQSIGLYPYFAAQTHRPYKDRINDADDIMRYVSQKFVESLWGDVSAAVCGGGKNRVFYDTEIPTMAFAIPDLIKNLLKSKDIEIVNKIDIADIRKVCKRTDYDAAFDLICRGDLNRIHQKALDTGDADIFRDFLERSDFYMVEREISARASAKPVPPLFSLSPTKRSEWRQEELQKFILGTLGNILEDLDAVMPHAPSSPVFISKTGTGAKPT